MPVQRGLGHLPRSASRPRARRACPRTARCRRRRRRPCRPRRRTRPGARGRRPARLREQRRHGFPHVDRQRVVRRRVVEADVQRAAVEPGLHAFGATIGMSGSAINRLLRLSCVRGRRGRARARRRISSVCSPRRGAARAMVLGVRSSCTGWPTRRCGPSRCETTSLTMPRCCTCGSSNTSRMSLMRPQATPPSLNCSIQWSRSCAARRVGRSRR